MDAVGHVADRNLSDGDAGPQPLPHLPAHGAVKRAHAVSPGRTSHRQDGNAEGLVIVGAVNPTQGERVRDIDVGRLQIGAGVALHLVRRELVVPCRNRRVRGEYVRRAHDLHGRGLAEAGPLAE